ncbi:MAG: DUF333 domain-containing protein [Myxococcales bacterium]|nr:DUF333 domain-containing protein [Myxococcales bacterium]
MKKISAVGIVSIVVGLVGCAAEIAPSGSSGQPVTQGPVSGCTALPASPSSGAPSGANPASVYCASMGYRLDGSTCILDDGARCEEWAFFRGECGQTRSFCARNGGTVKNVVEDKGGWTASYARCTLPSGASCDEATFARTCTCADPAPPPPPPAPACTPLASPGAGGAPSGANPASVYCAAMGYETRDSDCVFPSGARCEQWAFFRGTCGQAESFCAKRGGTVSNVVEDRGGFTASYARCTLPSGTSCEEQTFATTCRCE